MTTARSGRARPFGAHGDVTALIWLAATVAVITVTTIALLGAAGPVADLAAQRAVADLSASQRTVAVTTRAADDDTAQRRAVDDVLTSLPSGIETAVHTLTFPIVADAAPASTEVVVVAPQEWSGHLRPVDGEIPTDTATHPDGLPVAAPAGGPWSIGQTVLLGQRQTPAVVVGLWQPVDPSAPLPGMFTGGAPGTLAPEDAAGPLIAGSAQEVAALVDRPRLLVVGVASATSISATDLEPSATALLGLRDRLDQAGATYQGATVAGSAGVDLVRVENELRRDLGAVGYPAALLGAMALVAVLALAAELRRRWWPVAALLLARGANAGWLPLHRLPLLTGSALAGAATGAVLGGAGMARVVWAPRPVDIAMVAGAVAALTVLTIVVATRQRLAVDTRHRPWLVTSAHALVVLVAALAGWRWSDMSRRSEQPGIVEWAAPALTLVVLGAALALVARGLSRIVVAVVRRERGVRRLLAARMLRRSGAGAALTVGVMAGGAAGLAATAWTGGQLPQVTGTTAVAVAGLAFALMAGWARIVGLSTPTTFAEGLRSRPTIERGSVPGPAQVSALGATRQIRAAAVTSVAMTLAPAWLIGAAVMWTASTWGLR